VLVILPIIGAFCLYIEVAQYPCFARHCVKTDWRRSMPFGVESLLTLHHRNGVEIILAATVPVLLSVNHHRDGRRDGRLAGRLYIDDSNRGNQPAVAFPLK